MGRRKKSDILESRKIYVQFFGHFQITIDGKAITETSSRTRRPWSLLQLLMINRHKTLTRQQLVEDLWPDGESDQPEKALKNLVYRVRNFFASVDLPFAQETIIYRNGTYALNNELDWVLDFEKFEEYYNVASDAAGSIDDRITNYRGAVELYKGDFLTEHLYEDWVLPYNSYYRSLYFKCVEGMLELLEQEELYEEMETVAYRAIEFDRFEESLHLSYMKALIRQNKKSAAIAHYNNLSDMFYRELGVTPNEELRDLYKEISRLTGRVQTDLAAIKESMREEEATSDAFLCEFEVFRNLYRLEARSAERAGESVFIGLLTLMDDEGEPPKAEVANRAMTLLLEAIHSSLRRGDVVSRMSVSQYILMLPTITVENGEMVMSRIGEKFNNLSPFRNIRLDTHLQPLDPMD